MNTLKLTHRILECLDRNSVKEKFAVIANMIDWKSAFPRQCHKLGVESFMKNGVRPALIPILVNYFQDRKMVVKFGNSISEEKTLNGGGPQGATFGILEYLSQSNYNSDCVESENRFKFIDDLTILEIINILNIGITSYNIKSHVHNNIKCDSYYLPPENTKSLQHLDEICKWTEAKKMKVNEAKTKTMIFNFTRDYPISTSFKMNNIPLEVVNEMKLLGVVITSDLRWDKNTQYITKKAYSRMQLLHKIKQFNPPIEDMKTIYILFIRSLLEQCSSLWHYSLTLENINTIERVQKSAFKIILQKQYKTYKHALNILDMETLVERRENLFKSFVLKNQQNEKLKEYFIRNDNSYKNKLRTNEKYRVTRCNTDRPKNSTILQMQKIINEMEINQQ